MLCCCCQTLLAAAADRWTTAAKASSFANNLNEATLDEEFPVLYYNAGRILVYVDSTMTLSAWKAHPGPATYLASVSPGTPSGGTSRGCTMILRQRGFYATASAGANEVSTRPPALVEVSQPEAAPAGARPARQCARRLELQAAAPVEK